MPKQKSVLDMSPEARAKRREAKLAEMEKAGCPFGRWPNGQPRTRPEIPEEFRQQYSVYGITRGDGSKIFLNNFRSLKRAKKSVEENKRLLTLSMTAVEILRTRKVDFIELS